MFAGAGPKNLTLVQGCYTIDGITMFAIWEVMYPYISVGLSSSTRHPATWNQLRLALTEAAPATGLIPRNRIPLSLIDLLGISQHHV